MQASVIRDHSLFQAERLGYSRTPPLPLIDCDLLQPRPQQDVEKRALALSVVVAISYGLDSASGRSWLEREGLYGALSAAEESFVEDAGSVGGSPFQAQVEGLGIFAWALGHAPTLQFDQALPSNLVTIYPDLRNEESSLRFITGCHLRSRNELVSMLDLAYCLHWCTVDAPARSPKIQLHVVTERRRALEWMLSKDDWETISLDT
ncbi:uncharacterized protein DUF4272 [Cupriavidus gilardii J11]|uniref:Uncharacterized protein DUF4272 n=1 Tax=Cupriavidus gilardii J11 TaxID=936133 RepID=A0A562B1A0_9BURK|nr:uncharacterized protein DUF4272 [Cupriavidus gilardii J11]